MKKHVILSAIFLCILVGFKVYIGLSLIDWINSTFLVGMIALAITVMIRIWKTGFLSLFIGGFRILGNMVIPKTRSAERADTIIRNDDSLNLWKNNMSIWMSYLFTNLAVISITISIVSLFVYYQ